MKKSDISLEIFGGQFFTDKCFDDVVKKLSHVRSLLYDIIPSKRRYEIDNVLFTILQEYMAQFVVDSKKHDV